MITTDTRQTPGRVYDNHKTTVRVSTSRRSTYLAEFIGNDKNGVPMVKVGNKTKHLRNALIVVIDEIVIAKDGCRYYTGKTIQ